MDTLMSVNLTVNGQAVTLNASPNTFLVQALREHLHLTGTHEGCDTAQCGACTVLMNGNTIKSCNVLLAQAQGSQITTIEGLSDDRVGKAVTDAWVALDVAQCGYCQSGQIMSATALLKSNKRPNDAQIDAAMAGNVCRCGTYPRIRAAIKQAAAAIA